MDNFTLGTLTLADSAMVTVVDVIDNQLDGTIACDEALYVGTLELGTGAVLTTNGCRVYYEELVNNGSIPGLGVDVLELRESIPQDFDVDGDVDAADLAELLSSWGPCPLPCVPGDPADTCPADFDGDCDVDAANLAEVLSNWGPVP